MEVGFEMISIFRMHKEIEGTRMCMTLIFVQLVNIAQSSNVCSLTKMGHILMKVELQKARIFILQFHRRQKYGHNQEDYHSFPRCWKCGSRALYSSMSHHGKKIRDPVASWANCGSVHPAKFSWCRFSPHIRQAQHTRPSQQLRPAPRVRSQQQLKAIARPQSKKSTPVKKEWTRLKYVQIFYPSSI